VQNGGGIFDDNFITNQLQSLSVKNVENRPEFGDRVYEHLKFPQNNGWF